MKNKFILLIIIIVLSSCGKVDCPKFPDELLSWVPYTTNDTLSYKSNNKTLHHKIADNYRTTSYSYKKNCDCECDIHAGFSTELNEENYKIVATCSYYSDNNIAISYKFHSNDLSDLFEFHYDFLNNQLNNINNIIDYELNGELLSNVGVKENTNNEKIIKIYFTQKKGLIAFVDNANVEWELIE